jgi:hypothetical protein
MPKVQDPHAGGPIQELKPMHKESANGQEESPTGYVKAGEAPLDLEEALEVLEAGLIEYGWNCITVNSFIESYPDKTVQQHLTSRYRVLKAVNRGLKRVREKQEDLRHEIRTRDYVRTEPHVEG